MANIKRFVIVTSVKNLTTIGVRSKNTKEEPNANENVTLFAKSNVKGKSLRHTIGVLPNVMMVNGNHISLSHLQRNAIRVINTNVLARNIKLLKINKYNFKKLYF